MYILFNLDVISPLLLFFFLFFLKNLCYFVVNIKINVIFFKRQSSKLFLCINYVSFVILYFVLYVLINFSIIYTLFNVLYKPHLNYIYWKILILWQLFDFLGLSAWSCPSHSFFMLVLIENLKKKIKGITRGPKLLYVLGDL